METLYRVLINGELTAQLPLVESVETIDSAPQEYCGVGFNGQIGEVWEFVTDDPAAMEQALDSDPAVIIYVRKA